MTGQSGHLKKQFLDAFRQHGNVTAACAAAGMSRRQLVYEWQEHDQTFALEFRQAEVEATEHLEAEAHRRAVLGVEKPIYQGGVQVGAIREFSDTLLIFLLKARNPAKYRDRMDLAVSQTVIKTIGAIDPDAVL